MSSATTFGTAALLLGLTAVASAAEPQVYRLDPGEIARLQAAPPSSDEAFDFSLMPPRDKRIHGEVGAFVGTGGARGVFGSAAVPLGDSGMAGLSFETSRFGDDRYRRR